jgi:hypothetical protein
MDETTNSLIGGHPEAVRNGLGVLEADFWPARFRHSISALLKITGPNLFGPYFSVSALVIKQFGWLFST